MSEIGVNSSISCVLCNRKASEAEYMIISPVNGLHVCNSCAMSIADVFESVEQNKEDAVIMEVDLVVEDEEEDEEDGEGFCEEDADGFCVAEAEERGAAEGQGSIVKELMDYGMIPELMGRFPVVTELKLLNEDDIIRIMREADGSIIKEYEAIFALHGVKLEVEDEALREIARLSEERMIGARGLRGIMQEVMQDILFVLPQLDNKINACIVTKDTVYTGVPVLVEK